MRRVFPYLCTALLLAACGPSSDDRASDDRASDDQDSSAEEAPKAGTTPYGAVADVESYLLTIGPHVQQITQMQMHYETGLASSDQNSDDRRGTGRNLAARAEEITPQLQQLLQTFDALEPPPLLAPFHRDVRKLISLRLDAYGKTVEGWKAEQDGGAHEDIYREVEETLAEANQLIQSLNEQKMQIDSSLAASAAP